MFSMALRVQECGLKPNGLTLLLEAISTLFGLHQTKDDSDWFLGSADVNTGNCSQSVIMIWI